MTPFFYVRAKKIAGVFKIPPSKSHTMRAILFASLCQGRSTIKNALVSPDTFAMIKTVELFGAKILKKTQNGSTIDLYIEGANFQNRQDSLIVDAGNSGQVLRFAGAIAPLFSKNCQLTGDASILENRPVEELISGLRSLGIEVNCLGMPGRPPLNLKGELKAGHLKISAEDSQPLSAFLMLAPHLRGKTVIEVSSLGERPWVDLTLHWLKQRGVSVKNEDYKRFEIEGLYQFKPFEYEVPGDFSSAAFPAAAALITKGEVLLTGLDFDDVQGDKAIFSLFEKMGGGVEKLKEGARVFYSQALRGIEADLNDIVDALPVMAALACFAKTQSRFYNVEIARYKESDRVFSIAESLKKMGANVEETKDSLIIYPSQLQGALLDSFFDHRIAMALTIASFQASSPSFIFNTACVEKSYPGFAEDFKVQTPKKIAIIGHKGAGKTTLGKLIEKKTGLCHYDLDHELLKKFKGFKSVRELFTNIGESSFRKEESKVFEEVSKIDKAVVSLGGGTLEKVENTALLNHFDDVHLIKMSFDEWILRLKQQETPVYLDKDHFIDSAKAVYKRREKIFKELYGQ